MTNKEVIEVLQEQIDKYGQEYDDKGLEALKTAIKLLRISTEFINKLRTQIKEEASFAYADFDRYKDEIYGAEPDELPIDDFRYGLNRAIEIIDECIKEAADADCD